MKIIENKNIFNNLHPSLYSHHDDHYYYSTRHYERLEELYADSPPDNALLWCRHRILGRVFAGNHHMRRNQHCFLAIINILSGSLYFRYNSTTYLAEVGDTILMPPESDNEYLTGPSGEAEISILLIEGPLLKSILKETGLDQVACLHNADPAHMEKYFVRMAGLLRLPPDNAADEISLLCYEILQQLARGSSDPVGAPWSDLLNYMNNNLDRKLSMEKLTAKAGCGRTKLNSWFMKQFKLTPHRYLVRLRMCHAAGLLIGSDLSIKEISLLSGYNNPLNFSTEFKKFFHCSPRQYRKSSLDNNKEDI